MPGQNMAHAGWGAGFRSLPKWVLVSLAETVGELLFLPFAIFCMARHVFRLNLEDWRQEG